MTCKFDTPLTDDQISNAIDGIAEAAVQVHLEMCEPCRARLDQARRAEWGIRQGAHPTPARLGEYHLGWLDTSEKAVIESHLRLCGWCRDELATLRTFMAIADAPPPPAPALMLAPQERRGKPYLLELLPAMAAPVRSRVRSEETSYQYRAENLPQELEVALTWKPRLRTLTGQLLPDSVWAGALIVCQRGDMPVISVAADAEGAFKIPDMAGGNIRLFFATPDDRHAVLESLELPLQ